MSWATFMTKNLSVVMLVGKGTSSNIMYHALKDDFNIEKVVVENAVSKKRLLLSRVKQLGYMKVLGQVLFIVFSKLFSKFSKKRIEAIKKFYHLNDSSIDEKKVVYVESINDEKVIILLQDINPDAVVVNGSRIISEKILASIEKPFINTHVGITPKYRGVHGGYWALANGDIEHCGVTVHLVDSGIDTGGIIFQDTIDVADEDSFTTYPLLQIAKAIPLMKQALQNVHEGTLKLKNVNLPSILWYHPTLYVYLVNYFRKGVK